MSKNNNHYVLPVAAALAAFSAPQHLNTESTFSTPERTRARAHAPEISPANQPVHRQQQPINHDALQDPNEELFMDDLDVFYSENETSDSEDENSNNEDENEEEVAIEPAPVQRIITDFFPLRNNKRKRVDSDEDSADATTSEESSSTEEIHHVERYSMNLSGDISESSDDSY